MPGNGAIAGGGGWRTGSTITTITLNWSIRNINKRLSWLSWFWKKKAFQQQCYSIQLLLSLPAAPLRRVGPEQGSGVARVLPAEAAAEIIWGQYAASTLRALPYLHCNRNRWGPPNISNPQTHPEGGLEEPTVSAQKKPFLSFGTKVMCLWFSKTHGYSFPYWKWDHQTHSAKSPEIKILFLEALAGEFSHSVISDSLWPHGLQHTRLPCPLPTPRACSIPCPSCRWYHPTISSSVVPFSYCPQSFPASGSFSMSQFFASSGQSIGVSASASFLPVSIQDWFPLGLTGWISLQSKGLERVFSNTTVQKHQFFSAQLSL